MDDTTLVLLRVMATALIGWIATAHVIKTRMRIRPQVRRYLIVPAWFPWMGLALGGPVYQGLIPSTEALTAGVSFTAGMFMYLLLYARQRRRQRS